MKKTLVSLLILSTISIISFAQTTNTESEYNLTGSIGYGTENNWGNTGFNAGLAFSKPISNRFLLESGISYFTTAIYNAYKANPTFYANEERFYNVAFMNFNIQYLIGSDNSFFNAKIKVGPGVKYHEFKMLRRALVYNGPGPTYLIVPGSEIYEQENKFNFSLYSAINFDARINAQVRLGVHLDTYSTLIFLEHFMPGIHATIKLNGKK